MNKNSPEGIQELFIVEGKMSRKVYMLILKNPVNPVDFFKYGGKRRGWRFTDTAEIPNLCLQLVRY